MDGIAKTVSNEPEAFPPLLPSEAVTPFFGLVLVGLLTTFHPLPGILPASPPTFSAASSSLLCSSKSNGNQWADLPCTENAFKGSAL